MKKSSIFILAGLICFLLTGTPWAQPQGDAEGKAALYDPKTVETISGLVVAAPVPSSPEGMPDRVRLTVKTDKETIPVFLGPSWFIEKQEMKISALDQIQVTGSRIMVRGKPVIIAAEVKKGDMVLKLRDESGAPLWSAPKRPSRAIPPGREVYPQGQGLYWPGRKDNR